MSIGKLSNFIDFFNYVPCMTSDIRHKNMTSGDLYLFMGKQQNIHFDNPSISRSQMKQIEV